MRYLLFSLLLIGSLQASADKELFRWVDDKGNMHYSDKPTGEGAQPYEPPPIQTVPSSLVGSLKQPGGEADKSTEYESMSIIAPNHDQVFTPDKSASIAVSVNLRPELQTGLRHQIALLLDGRRHGKGQRSSFVLADLTRGAHTVSAVVLDEAGKTLFTSDSVSFHVQRHHR